MLKVALIGRMGSGKSELAKRLASHLNMQKVALGDALKAQILEYNLIPTQKIEKSRDRETLQNYGQFRRGEIEFFRFNNSGIAHAIQYPGSTQKEALLLMDYKFQHVGACYADYWIDLLRPKIAALEDEELSIVNDDIRRLNEWNAFKQMGFTMVKVQCDESIRIARLMARDGGYDPTRMEDISESEVDILGSDFVIENNDTIDSAFDSLLSVI